MLAVALAMWAIARRTAPLPISPVLRGAVGAALLVGSASFALPAFRAFARAGTTIDPVHIQNASALVTGGIYGITRNPMYVALTGLLLAWAAFLAAPWTLLGPVAFAAFIDRFQIQPEERAMQLKFGAQYDAYKGKVRRWL